MKPANTPSRACPDALANTQTIVREQSLEDILGVDLVLRLRDQRKQAATATKTCECGSAAVGGLAHSDYCPMFEGDK